MLFGGGAQRVKELGGEKVSRRLLEVTVEEARNLKAIKPPATTFANFKIYLKDLAGREVKSESFHSDKASKSSLAPVWSKKFQFGSQYDLNNIDVLPSLMISLYHKDNLNLLAQEVPLGSIEIPLTSITTDEDDRWYPLEGGDVSGDIHIKIKFNKTVMEETETLIGGLKLQSPDKTGKEVQEDIDSNEDQSPNNLEITLIQARNLLIMDRDLLGRKTSSDPIVVFKVKDFPSRESTVVNKNTNPIWNQTYNIQKLRDSSLSLEVTVYDINSLRNKDFMGRVNIPLNEYFSKKATRKWYRLRSENLEADGVDRGEIELHLWWKWDSRVAADERKEKKGFLNKVKSGVSNLVSVVTREEAESDPEDDDNEVADKPEEKPSAEAQSQQKEEAAAKEKALSEIEIRDGDYQVQVHIIEARDLKAENMDGTSDPITTVECFGERQHTRVIYGQTSCVFDELLIFNKKDLEKEDFENQFIRISVRDANSVPGMKNKMIGAYVVDAQTVYCTNKDHEIYRQWIPLMDDEDKDDSGVQGFLKISIQIIGPKDKLKIHDEAAELAKEMAREAAAGDDVSSLVLSVPQVRKDWMFVVVSVYRCEGLPVMDGKVGIGIASIGAKTDAYCEMSVGGAKPIKTKIRTVYGDSRQAINPEFNYELWFPISIPTMTQLIKFSVLDYDPEKNELIGNITEKYNNIDKAPGRQTDLKWYNMYGAPEFKNSASLIGDVKKATTAVANVATLGLLSGVNWADFYNNVPDKASAYKGRALLKFRIATADQRPGRHKTPEIVPFRKKINPMRSTPPTRNYILQAIVFNGSELPSFLDLTLTGAVTGLTSAVTLNQQKKQELRVRVSIGPYDFITNSAKYEKGMCRWNQFIKSDVLSLPEDLSQVPDIFIYLVKEDLKPVCFCRIKAVDLQKKSLYGFDKKADWFLLKEDKSIDALLDGEFPGSLLLKLGFGYEEDAKPFEKEWTKALEDAKTLQSYQMRVHVYQCKNVQAADADGLSDCFIKVNFMGNILKTKTIKESLYPAFYETMVFNNIMIPEVDNFLYAPQVSLRIFDEDLGGVGKSTYLGMVNLSLGKAFKTEDAKTSVDKFPDPTWEYFFKESLGDGQGAVLVSIQLIPTLGREIPTSVPDPNPIVPKTRPAIVELIIIGCRDLAPYNFVPIQAPFLEMELSSFKSKFLSQTQVSKKPSPQNPNFLEQINMDCLLPVKSIFAAPLQLRIKDTRLGGYLKPIVGVGIIDLSTKLPWCKDTYIAPQTDIFSHDKGSKSLDVDMATGLVKVAARPGENTDAVAQKLKNVESQRQQDEDADELLATKEPPSLTQYIQERTAIEDTGAGVFGAMSHIKYDKKKKTKEDIENMAFSKVDVNVEEEEQPPAWQIGRKFLEGELETEFKTTPFETYAFTRGKATSMFGSTLKVVGILKGLVRVKEHKDDPDIFPKELINMLMKPKYYKVRLYVLRGVGLAKMDKDIFGNATSSDPYLKVSLGKFKFDDRKNAIDDMTDVDFYKMIEMDCELPGTSQLKIEVMDKDTIGSDELIGKTTIDLEDRWFDERWQQLGSENKRDPGEDPANPTACRWETKPVERRTLFQPSAKMGQGILECWVDILKPEFASTFPPDNIALPPTKTFEVRVVIWKTKNVPAMDELEGMSDLFIKCWPEGCEPQETDTHWRCKKGKGSFNYRLLFDVELGHSTRAMKFPYLHIQLWDRDILKWNDCAGEGVMNLGKYYRKAYKKNVALKLFETPNGAAAKRAKKPPRIDTSRDPSKYDTNADIPPEETAATTGDNSNSSNPIVQQAAVSARDKDSDDDDDVEVQTKITSPKGQSGTAPLLNKGAVSSASTSKPEEKKKEAVKKSWFSFGTSDDDVDEVDDDDDDAEEPLLQPKKDEEEEANEEAVELVQTFKGMTGVWDVDPPDSSWYNVEKHDHNTGDVIPMGSIAFSVQIWPKEKALQMPAGSARQEPNSNPFLPPPVGRLKWSWNPFVLGSELCGPALCAKLFCCMICLSFIALMIFCQPFLNIIINLIFVVF